MAALGPRKVTETAKVHPYNIDDDDPHLHETRPNEAPAGRIYRVGFILAAVLGVLTSVGCLIVTIMWFTLRPGSPTLWLNSLSIPTFFVSSNSTLTAKYDVGFTFKNPNQIWNIVLGGIEVIIFYKKPYTLATTTVNKAIHLGMEKEKLVEAKFEEGEQWYWGESILEDIRRDFKDGNVSFHLNIRASVACHGSRWALSSWRENGAVLYSCVHLKVAFNATTGGGNLLGFLPRQCYLRWW